MSGRVAVIGAGWSGLACALELTGAGVAVTLLDAAPQPGGRARAVAVRLGDREFTLDNGQHLLIGAYGETLRRMREVGVATDETLLRLPFELRYPDGFLLRRRRLPAPLDLAAGVIGAARLGWWQRWHVVGFVLRWQSRAWTIAPDAPASTLFASAPAELVRRLWRPLCLAALNVEPADASAQTLLTVLRDSLAGGAGAADLLLPRRDLTQAFAGPAVDILRARGAEVRLRSPVRHLSRGPSLWRLAGPATAAAAEAVVLALPPRRAADLLASTQRPDAGPAIALLRAVDTAPIATVYLRYPPGVRLPWPASALLDDPDSGRFGQWVFDRGQLDASNDGVLSVVVSAAGAALAAGPAALSSSVAMQLAADLGLPEPLAAAVLAEKRATIAPSPGLRRPPTRLPVPALYLAGDAAHSEYPSTLEGSVRAGIAAARAIIADRGAGVGAA
ncbi:MAG: hydroxysqualene dehydroxylase HpnE [Burkholderiaceae bacterium]|nr:hydroxysqualene dehydroxylase HpnE [Burkholderiaceae bacterium]